MTPELDPYDVFPYGGRAVPLSHPDRLFLAGVRAGMSPADPQSARVLELGCAEGANLVPMAFHLERARFVGVDGSRVQIERGLAQAARLGLDNLELRHERIEELEEPIGEHDYVIAHGVFSWVSDAVRDRMLALVRRCLAPGGVVYLSFNCAPGWAIRGEVRRALLRRVEGVDDAATKIGLARELLAMFVRSPLRDSPYGALLAAEASNALAHRDAYLLHEYLAKENRAFYFGEIEALARAHDLVVFDELGTAAPDPQLESGLLAGFAATIGDRTRAEEMTELLLFRSFRMALLRRSDAPLAADPRAARLELARRARYAAPLRTEAGRISLDPGVHETFVARDGSRIQTESALLKAALLEIAKSWPVALTFQELAERAELVLAMRRVVEAGQAIGDAERAALLEDLLALVDTCHLDMRLRDAPPALSTTDQPRVSALTRAEAERSEDVTNPHGEIVVLDPLTRRLVRHLDGTRGMDELLPIARGYIQSEALSVTDAEGTAIAPEELETVLPDGIGRAVAALAARQLLV